MGDSARPATVTKLTRAVETLRPHALARLDELVSAESPTGDRARIDVVNDLLTSTYEATGAIVERVPGEPTDHLVCTWEGSARRDSTGHVLLIGHSDTVLPAGTTSTRPFRLADDNDTVVGPGVYDMKGGLVLVELAMLAMRHVRTTEAPRTRPVRLVVVSDEEIGSPDGSRIVTMHTDGATAALGLEPPLPGGAVKIGRHGVMRYRLSVDGVEAHAGLDSDRGVSAIDELVDQLRELRRAAPGGTDAAVNIGTIEGGTGANVVAGSAAAQIGLRFRTADAERRLTELLSRLELKRQGASITLTRLSHRPPWEPDPTNPVAAELASLAALNGWSLGKGVSDGAGDTNATGAAGIPTVDGLGPDGGGAHATSEWASVSSLLQRAALLAAYLLGRDSEPTVDGR